MKSSKFGVLAATAAAGILASSIALAGENNAGHKKEDGKAAKAKTEEKAAGVCKSNSCANHVAGGKNECAGHVAEGVTSKEACEKDGKGTWSAAAHK